jgi:ABC-type lipoprotein release transport system permease subunit
MKIMKIARMFIAVNIKRSMPAILALATFLVSLNIGAFFGLPHSGLHMQSARAMVLDSIIIGIVPLILSIINIRSNVRQMLDWRQHDIGLLSLFGMRSRDMLKVLIAEFVCAGLVAFVVSVAATVLWLVVFKAMLGIVHIRRVFPFLTFYLVIDAIIAVVLYTVIATIQASCSIRRINNARSFKEMLK